MAGEARGQESAPASQPAAQPVSEPASQPVAPVYADADSHVFATREQGPLMLHVVKPDGWAATDKRVAWIHFYGGGWIRGTTDSSIGWARSAAKRGMVGIAPDYRTRERHGTTPAECVADARAALRWVQDHAAELGVDPARIVVSGNSAGGHVALWTAIEHAPPVSDPAESPRMKPAALILSSPVADTSPETGYAAERAGEHALELSPVDQLDAKMPPVLLLHGDADKTVPYSQAVDLNARLTAAGNKCTFVTVPGGSHNFRSDLPEWKNKTREYMDAFLKECGLD
ncbi:MAG: hypothetical protein PWP23_1902 [Candidatus Sumerlaeota bacterium]|nr:hypothetical protein [Candidatus Sumerlaeota bacterium]